MVRGRKRQDGPSEIAAEKNRHLKHYEAHWKAIVEKRRTLYQYCKENRLCTRCQEALPEGWTKGLCEKHNNITLEYARKKKESRVATDGNV